MKRILAAVFLLVLVGLAPESGALQNDWGLNENDWTVVSDGWAGGMTNCTARTYCTSCEEPLEGGARICTKAYRDANCKCGYFYQQGRRCLASGACLYRPV